MELRELEFKAEEVEDIVNNAIGFAEMNEASAIEATKQLNHILRERLAKAPEVFGHDDAPPIWGTLWTMEPAKQMKILLHHRARLVCIENYITKDVNAKYIETDVTRK